jgi:RNA polymerase sigma-70 factor (ECF subfamily)
MVSDGRIGAEALFREHASFIASFLSRLGTAEADVEDAVQEVFMVAHKKGGYLPGPAKPRSWLAAIAVRIGASSRRSRARRREDFDLSALETTKARGLTPDRAAEIAEKLLDVQAALDQLDVEHRVPLILFEIDGEPCESIAAALQVPTGTIYSRLHTARKKFAAAYRIASEDGLVRAEEPKSA